MNPKRDIFRLKLVGLFSFKTESVLLPVQFQQFSVQPLTMFVFEKFKWLLWKSPQEPLIKRIISSLFCSPHCWGRAAVSWWRSRGSAHAAGGWGRTPSPGSYSSAHVNPSVIRGRGHCGCRTQEPHLQWLPRNLCASCSWSPWSAPVARVRDPVWQLPGWKPLSLCHDWWLQCPSVTEHGTVPRDAVVITTLELIHMNYAGLQMPSATSFFTVYSLHSR